MFDKFFSFFKKDPLTSMRQFLQTMEELMQHFEENNLKEGVRNAALDALIEFLQQQKSK